jgi:hypothetical protein
MVLHATMLTNFDQAAARALLLESHDLAEKTGRPALEAVILNTLHAMARGDGDSAAAVEYAERSLAAVSGADVSPEVQTVAHLNLGVVRFETGAPPAEIRQLLLEGLDWAAQTRSPMTLAGTLECLAYTSVVSDPEGAARLLSADIALRRVNGLGTNDLDRSDIDTARRQIEVQIGQTRTAELMKSIDDITIDEAIQLARTLAWGDQKREPPRTTVISS